MQPLPQEYQAKHRKSTEQFATKVPSKIPQKYQVNNRISNKISIFVLKIEQPS